MSGPARVLTDPGGAASRPAAVRRASSSRAALAIWSRRGGSGAARWWVRRLPLNDARSNSSMYREATGLFILPYLAQLLLVAGIGAFPGIPEPVIPVLVIGEIVLGLAACTQIRLYVLPLWIYPSWLQERRRRDWQWLDRQ